MKSIFALSTLILLVFSTWSAQAQHLTKLGERLSTCKNLENDDWEVSFDPALQTEARSQFDDDQLIGVILPADNCFRIGTEVKFTINGENIPALGRALTREMKLVSRGQLASDPLNPFSRTATNRYVQNNPASRYAILRFTVSEKVTEAFVDEQYKRLPTCFPSFSDWESMPNSMKEIEDIQKGRTKAHIWNGTFNCYKVGVYTELILRRERREDERPSPLGFILPTELHLVHYSNLNSKHAALLDEPLPALRKRMEKNKQIDGGFTTIVVFEYAAPRPEAEEETEARD